jgi:hypothetical protein
MRIGIVALSSCNCGLAACSRFSPISMLLGRHFMEVDMGRRGR